MGFNQRDGWTSAGGFLFLICYKHLFWALVCDLLGCIWANVARPIAVRFSAQTVLQCAWFDGFSVESKHAKTVVTLLSTLRHREPFYLHDTMLARVIGIVTCLSVRPSVTCRYCVKTKKASGMIFSPSGSPMLLVFWCQISSQNSKGLPRTGASKKGGVGKFSDFLALCVNISKTVADRAKVTI